MSKHTGGGWKTDPKNGRKVICGEQVIGTAAGQVKNPPEAWANARLFAAAPELLEACKAFEKWFSGWCPNSQCCASSGKHVHDQVVKAIKAAEAP